MSSFDTHGTSDTLEAADHAILAVGADPDARPILGGAQAGATRIGTRRHRVGTTDTVMKQVDSILSDGGDLRRAVAWVIEQPQRDARTIEEASRRFDLSPLDEAFLLEHFRDSGRGGSVR